MRDNGDKKIILYILIILYNYAVKQNVLHILKKINRNGGNCH